MHACRHGWMDGCLSVCMYACMHGCMSDCLSVCMYACMHGCMSDCLSVRPSVRSVWSVWSVRSVRRSVGPSVCRSVGLSVCRSVCLYVCICVYNIRVYMVCDGLLGVQTTNINQGAACVTHFAWGQKQLYIHHDSCEGEQWGLYIIYPLVNIQKAIENDHRNSGFSH